MRMADQVLLLLDGVPIAGQPRELQKSSDPRIAGFLSEEADDTFDPAALAGRRSE